MALFSSFRRSFSACAQFAKHAFNSLKSPFRFCNTQRCIVSIHRELRYCEVVLSCTFYLKTFCQIYVQCFVFADKDYLPKQVCLKYSLMNTLFITQTHVHRYLYCTCTRCTVLDAIMHRFSATSALASSAMCDGLRGSLRRTAFT